MFKRKPNFEDPQRLASLDPVRRYSRHVEVIFEDATTYEYWYFYKRKEKRKEWKP